MRENLCCGITRSKVVDRVVMIHRTNDLPLSTRERVCFWWSIVRKEGSKVR